MKILFAAPDRDLLECYKKLLETDLGETVTAFDGTQVITLLSTESFDIALLDRNLPRVDHKTIIERANAKNVPVVVLTDGPAGLRNKADEPVPDGMLSYPFTFDSVKDAVRHTLESNIGKERKEAVKKDE
ncbi:MAG: response regulator [Clostridia bacterium]|nr:response regulator [Clostridia bacterium]